MARASCLMLFELFDRAAASRTFWTAGRSRPMRIAMIAITTKSSINVKPRRLRRMGRDLWVRRNGEKNETARRPSGGTGHSELGNDQADVVLVGVEDHQEPDP